MNEFIVYEGNGEVLITTVEQERSFLGEYFCEGTGRDAVVYDRTVVPRATGVLIRSALLIDA